MGVEELLQPHSNQVERPLDMMEKRIYGKSPFQNIDKVF